MTARLGRYRGGCLAHCWMHIQGLIFSAPNSGYIHCTLYGGCMLSFTKNDGSVVKLPASGQAGKFKLSSNSTSSMSSVIVCSHAIAARDISRPTNLFPADPMYFSIGFAQHKSQGSVGCTISCHSAVQSCSGGHNAACIWMQMSLFVSTVQLALPCFTRFQSVSFLQNQ